MKIDIEKVLERDIDLLMINKFYTEEKTADYFSNKIGIKNYKVEQIQHSVSDENGESDITVILNNGKNKIAFLIEDKIDAIAMPNQRNRYNIRGNKGIENNKYEKYYVFMIAPNAYLKINAEAKKYENQISYEELIKLFEDDLYAKTLLEKAIEEKDRGYIVIENENVTRFWADYYNFIFDNYPTLNINTISGPRGSYASWQTFNVATKNVRIRHKSDKGFVDMEFSNIANDYKSFTDIVRDYLDSDMSIEKTGKSLSIRIKVPTIDCKQEFSNYLSEMEICMNAVIRLQELLKKADKFKLTELLQYS